ncbi:MAG TPA: hypothetical protein VFM95_00610 [Microcella sp.]|nr:hypothetical protein [Microcella sp.]
MSSLSTRAALGSTWATHWLLWLAFFPLTTALVVYREIPLGPPNFGWSIVSAVAQHLAVGVIVIGGGLLLRRNRYVLPLHIIITLWMLAALARAAIEFVISDAFYASTSSFVIDAAIWVALSVFWVPVTVFAIAQFEQRRMLITARDIAADDLARERAAASESTQQLQARLLATVTAQLTPVLRDLEDSLDTARRRLGGGAAAEIGMRISRLHDETADLVAGADEAVSYDDSPGPATRATFRRAFAIEAALPARSATFVTLAALVAVVPDTVRVVGLTAAWSATLAIVAAGVLLAIVPIIVSRVALPGMTYLKATILGQSIAIAAATGVLVALGSVSSSSVAEWALAVITAVAIGAAHSTYTAAFIVADANRVDDAALSHLVAETTELAERRSERSRAAREQMAQLMHGPIQGRLAACVMALNFHAGIAGSDPERADAMLTSVMDHLHAVAVDLQRLGEQAESATDSP